MRIEWNEPGMISDPPCFQDKGRDARNVSPGNFGAEYARMAFLPDGKWLVVCTLYNNAGYIHEASGGSVLQLLVSEDQGEIWKQISVVEHPGRDLDNGQLLVLDNGNILLTCRSVRWQESYQLPVYRSCDGGATWEFVTIIDERNGAPGSLGNPDKGMYEPHMDCLGDGRISVLYANEKHVTSHPYYSQIVSQRISEDGGETWGDEIFVAWDESRPCLRPGMPVWIRTDDEKYLVVYEVVIMAEGKVESASVYYKFSEDGITWEQGIGCRIPDQDGGPFLAQTEDGTLVVTSVSGKISASRDGGETWEAVEDLPFLSHLWPSLYPLEGNRIALLNSCKRSQGGNNVQICLGRLI